MKIRLRAVLAVLLLLASPLSGAQGVADAPVRLIVQLRADDADRAAMATANTAAADEAAARAHVARLADRSGLGLRALRRVAPDVHVVLAGPGVSLAQALARLRAQPDVVYAEEDMRMHIAATGPNDPLYAQQWYLQSTELAAIHADAAWNLTTGDSSVVVAVLDTGITSHVELSSKILPGYDFIAEDAPGVYDTANDGNGRDNNPADPGDGDVTTPSSWHGTRVAGIIGAIANNNEGISGVAPQVSILPVRVLGVGGGFASDIAAAMRWAAGLSVPGVPVNTNPARVLNLSLAGAGTCESTYQQTVSAVTAAGAVIVAAAGNDDTAVSQPANCPGVLAVAGVRHTGTKVGYSSFGSQVGISAPAGNCVNVNDGETCLYSIISTVNAGTLTPDAATNTYTTTINPNANVGTSFSAPQVAGVAALMLSHNPDLLADRLLERIKGTARAFPADSGLPTCPNLGTGTKEGQCNCTTSTCGAGLLDAGDAVADAARAQSIPVVPSAGGVGAPITLTGSGSLPSPGATINTWLWESNCGTIADPAAADTTLTLPGYAGTCTVKLTVTDDAATSDTHSVYVKTNAPAVHHKRGGGGTLPVAVLCLLALLARRRAVTFPPAR